MAGGEGWYDRSRVLCRERARSRRILITSSYWDLLPVTIILNTSTSWRCQNGAKMRKHRCVNKNCTMYLFQKYGMESGWGGSRAVWNLLDISLSDIWHLLICYFLLIFHCHLVLSALVSVDDIRHHPLTAFNWAVRMKLRFRWNWKVGNHERSYRVQMSFLSDQHLQHNATFRS